MSSESLDFDFLFHYIWEGILVIPFNMATYQIPAPTPMSLKGDVVENWQDFEAAWDDYLLATQLNEKLVDDKKKPNPAGMAQVAATLCSVMGSECKKVLSNLPGLTEAQRKDPAAITKALRDHFIPQRNVVYERFVFWNASQRSSENSDEYVLRLRKLADSCEFGSQKDSMMRDRIVCGTSDKQAQDRLLRERPPPGLARAVEIVKVAEISRQHVDVIGGKGSNQVEEVNKSRNRGRRNNSWQNRRHDQDRSQVRQNRQGQNRQKLGRYKSKTQPQSTRKFGCGRCGGNEPHRQENCPAKDAECFICKRRGHFANLCRAKTTHEVEDEDVDSDTVESVELFVDHIFLDEVSATSGEFWSVDLAVDSKMTEFKLDTGSKICVIGQQTPWINQRKLEKSTSQFRGPGGVSLNNLVIGVIRNAEFRIGDRCHKEDLYIMRRQRKNLLSKSAIQALQLLKPDTVVHNVDKIPNFRKEFPKLFTGLGLLSEPYKIPLKDDAVPVCIYTPRRVPHPLLPKVKKQLEKMEKMKVISRVMEPTEWCAGMVPVPKPSGEVRICVDLTPLNKGVKREIHPMCSVDENLAKIQDSKMFTKLDANSGFWQIPLNPSSRLLTTFVTPYGRFCFNWLPFGISSAPEVFQRTMSRILEGLEGVICHMDDILIHGPTQDIHDQRVRQVLDRLTTAGVTLNDKCEFSKREICFLGHVITQEGIQAQPEKIKAIQNFPTPRNVPELQRFNGMVNQLAKFLPGLASVNEPLRQLLKKDQHWIWDQPQETAFRKIKETLVSTEVLAHYDPNRHSVVAADASQKGVGAVLLQVDKSGNRRPIAYASRSLTDTEKRYAVIEKEALAATWACEKFSDYITGTTFTLETDHRPLVPLLSSTDLSKLPARILRFRLRMMKYSPEIRYVQGTHQKTADALSRAPTGQPSKEEEIKIEEVESFRDSVIRNLPATDQRIEQIRETQKEDAICAQIRSYVQEGWPPIRPNQPLLKPYFDNASHFTIEDDILMFDMRLVIPQTLQLFILNKIHDGHLGITKCKERAYNSVWWPTVTAQVEAMCRKCIPCILNQDNKIEPLMALSPPEEIWERVGTDLFHHNKKDYMVIVDYGSKWLDFKQLKNTTSLDVIKALCEVFATHGIPKVVVSDNGPQYASSEFAQFAKEWGFTHVTSSPRYPRANGEAERAVKTAKSILTKNDNPFLGLMAYRSAPIHNGLSPSQLLMSRRLRTTLPTVPKMLAPEVPDRQVVKRKEVEYKQKYTQSHDSRHRVVHLPSLSAGDLVYVRDQSRYGEVVEKLSNPRSYRVSMDNGNVLTRNRGTLLHTGSTVDTPTSPTPESDTSLMLPPTPASSPPPPSSSPVILSSQLVPLSHRCHHGLCRQRRHLALD